MNRGSEAFQVLKLFLKPTLQILLWMTLLRILLFLFVFYDKIAFHPDLPAAFWAGFRFDVLVLGFFWIPVVVWTWLSAVFLRPRKNFNFWKFYFVLVMGIVLVLSWLDFFWTAAQLTRLNHELFAGATFEILKKGWMDLGSIVSLFATICLFLSFTALSLSLIRLKWQEPMPDSSRRKLFLQVTGSVVVVAFAARGTWTPHHLNIEHARVSQAPLVNELPLNPAWNLDK